MNSEYLQPKTMDTLTYVTLFSVAVTLPSFSGTTVLLGHSAIWREKHDTVRNAIILIDPTITVHEPSILAGWNVFTVHSRRRERIKLQIWRPNTKVTGRRRMYRLVSEVEFYAHNPGATKFMLQRNDRVSLESGDTMGIYFPGYNPIPWDMVQCHGGNNHLFKYNPSKLGIGSEYPFETADTSWKPCRQYSLNATTVTQEEADYMDEQVREGAARIYAPTPYGYSHEFMVSRAVPVSGSGRMAVGAALLGHWLCQIRGRIQNTFDSRT